MNLGWFAQRGIKPAPPRTEKAPRPQNRCVVTTGTPRWAPAHAALRSWLTETGSATARCIRHSRQFAVRPLAYGKARPLGDEANARLCWARSGARMRRRAGHLRPYDARLQPGGRLTRWLAGLAAVRSARRLLLPRLQARPHPVLRRLDARHPLYRRAAQPWPAAGSPRRGDHCTRWPVSALVTEAFCQDRAAFLNCAQASAAA